MAESILKEFKLDVEGLTLVPGDKGQFEVTVNGDLVFSKLSKGRFPEYGEVRPEVQKRR